MSNYIDNIVKNAVTYDLVSKPLADDMANEFSIQSTYAVGDYVMHDYKLYKCISAITTAGNWNSAKWQECKIGDEINGGVKFTAQTLTSEQKAQARNNIGAISQEEATPDAVRYSAQSLTDAQKNQARVNVGTVASTSIAEEFSTSKAYAVGDLVMYDSKLYKFKTAHSAGAWNNAQVDAVSVKEEISSLSNDLSETVKFTEQTLTEAQKAQAKQNIGIADDGLSDTAKQALLNCLNKVMWINEDAKNLLDSLRNALYSGWDYVWDASSGILPEGLTKIGDATWGPNNEYVDVVNPSLILPYGDIKAEFEIAYVSQFGYGSTSLTITFSNHVNHAVKMSYDDNEVFAIRSNGPSQSIDIASLHLYSVNYVGGVATISQDGQLLGEYENYRSVYNSEPLVYRNPASNWNINHVVLRFKSLKYKIIGNVENDNIIYLYKGYGISSQDYSSIVQHDNRCLSEPIPFINNTSISILLSQEFAEWANSNGNIYLKVSTNDLSVHFGTAERIRRYSNNTYTQDGDGGLMNSSNGEYRIVNTSNARIKCDNTNGTFRLLLGRINSSTPVGTITITGKTYMLVVKDSSEFR